MLTPERITVKGPTFAVSCTNAELSCSCARARGCVSVVLNYCRTEPLVHQVVICGSVLQHKALTTIAAVYCLRAPTPSPSEGPRTSAHFPKARHVLPPPPVCMLKHAMVNGCARVRKHTCMQANSTHHSYPMVSPGDSPNPSDESCADVCVHCPW